MFKYCANPACRRSFHLSQFRASISDGMQPGQIICPYCGFRTTDDAETIFLAYALAPDEEQQVNEQSR